MRKQIILATLMIFTTLWGCQKQIEAEMLVQQDIVFSISQVDPFLLKDAGHEPECVIDETGNLIIPSVAEVIVDGTTHYPGIYFLNGKLYTQSIKVDLPGGEPATFNISRFALLETINGHMVMATPVKGSFYGAYVDSAVDFDIEVLPSAATIVPVEVLCFIPDTRELYGFNIKSPEGITSSNHLINISSKF